MFDFLTVKLTLDFRVMFKTQQQHKHGPCPRPHLQHWKGFCLRSEAATAAYESEMAEEAILSFLQANDEIADSHEFAAGIGVDHTELENVIKRLSGFEIVDSKVFASFPLPIPGFLLGTLRFHSVSVAFAVFCRILRKIIIFSAKRGNAMHLRDRLRLSSSRLFPLRESLLRILRLLLVYCSNHIVDRKFIYDFLFIVFVALRTNPIEMSVFFIFV